MLYTPARGDFPEAVVFSKLDLHQRFLQIPVVERDQAKTCYWVGNRLMAYLHMLYGLRNASANFQRVMDMEVAQAGLDHCTIAYIDDVLIWSDFPEKHEKDVAAVLDMLHTCSGHAQGTS